MRVRSFLWIVAATLVASVPALASFNGPLCNESHYACRVSMAVIGLLLFSFSPLIALAHAALIAFLALISGQLRAFEGSQASYVIPGFVAHFAGIATVPFTFFFDTIEPHFALSLAGYTAAATLVLVVSHYTLRPKPRPRDPDSFDAFLDR